MCHKESISSYEYPKPRSLSRILWDVVHAIDKGQQARLTVPSVFCTFHRPPQIDRVVSAVATTQHLSHSVYKDKLSEKVGHCDAQLTFAIFATSS